MIFALSGPSGIGKGFAKEAILEQNPEIKEAVWYTTRELRPGEKNRKSLPGIEFTALHHNEKLVLVQELFGHRYGILKSFLTTGGDILTEIHPFVAGEAKKINPDIVLIGMVTDDIDLLRERLAQKRKTESPEEIEKRVAAAKREIEAIRENYQLFDTIIAISRETEGSVGEMAQSLFKIFSEGGKKNASN